MTAAISFTLDLLVLVLVAGLLLTIYSIVQVVRVPGLPTGTKWGWGLGIGVGYWLFWLPGVILAIVFLSKKKQWSAPRQD